MYNKNFKFALSNFFIFIIEDILSYFEEDIVTIDMIENEFIIL
jgi:hypothetical protein